MAKSISWSEESLNDIECIAEFISRDSAHHAQRFVDEVFHVVEIFTDSARNGASRSRIESK